MRYCTIPADLATLAKAQAGQELEVRHLLVDARCWGVDFAPGDRITCDDVSDSGLMVSTKSGTRVHVPWRWARRVQVERQGIDDASAGDGERARPKPIRLLTAGPVARLLARKGGRRARLAAAHAPAADVRRHLARCLDA